MNKIRTIIFTILISLVAVISASAQDANLGVSAVVNKNQGPVVTQLGISGVFDVLGTKLVGEFDQGFGKVHTNRGDLVSRFYVGNVFVEGGTNFTRAVTLTNIVNRVRPTFGVGYNYENKCLARFNLIGDHPEVTVEYTHHLKNVFDFQIRVRGGYEGRPYGTFGAGFALNWNTARGV